MSNPQAPILVDEHVCAQAIGMSIHWLRKDRRSKQIVPTVYINESVRYHLPTVLDSLMGAAS